MTRGWYRRTIEKGVEHRMPSLSAQTKHDNLVLLSSMIRCRSWAEEASPARRGLGVATRTLFITGEGVPPSRKFALFSLENASKIIWSVYLHKSRKKTRKTNLNVGKFGVMPRPPPHSKICDDSAARRTPADRLAQSRWRYWPVTGRVWPGHAQG